MEQPPADYVKETPAGKARAKMKESYLTTHPYIRRLIYWAAALVTIVLFVTLFGPDRTWGLISSAFQSGSLIAEAAK